MIHAVGQRFDVPVKHRAGAASAHAMHVQIFPGGFLAFGDCRADFRSKNFLATAVSESRPAFFNSINVCLTDFLASAVCDGANGVQILRFKQPKCISLGNAFPSGDLVIDVAQLAALNEEVHFLKLSHGKTTSATVTIRKTALISALRRKKARLIQFKLRRRAIQCSSTRQPTMINQPTRYAMRN